MRVLTLMFTGDRCVYSRFSTTHERMIDDMVCVCVKNSKIPDSTSRLLNSKLKPKSHKVVRRNSNAPPNYVPSLRNLKL